MRYFVDFPTAARQMLKQYFTTTANIRCIFHPFPSAQLSLYEYRTVQAAIAFRTYYYRYSALGPVWAENRVQSDD